MNRFAALLTTGLLATVSVLAQTTAWDTSGNSLLTGTYNFREALWITDAQAGNALNEAASQYGTITFDGQGNYTANVSAWSSRDSLTTYTRTGTYAISASGFGFLRRVSADGDYVYGSVVNGVFIGSGTESGFNNLFVAARQSAQPLTAAAFNQRYTLAYFNLGTANLAQVREAFFQINPNGAGSLSTVAVSGYSGGIPAVQTQSIPNATYTVTGGTATLNFGAKNATDLVSGPLQMFTSPDGQLIFGGAANGWDMFVGIRTPASASTAYDGLYYQAGINVDRIALPAGTAVLDSYYGSANIISSLSSVIGHQRLAVSPDAPYEYTYSDLYALSAASVHSDALGFEYVVSSDGTYRIGYGRQDFLGLNVAVKVPAFSGSGVYLNPTGVVNAASFTPFTAGIAPGELITLFGTGLAAENAVDATFPLTLAGTAVRINGRQAPIYVVSPTQLSVIVPYETTGVADIVVSRNGVSSNRVTLYVNRTAPGVFAVPATGLGFAAALHPDFSLVTTQNPARIGETIAVYLTGLGAVNPAIANGDAGPVDPLARTTETLDVHLGNRTAKIVYSGLAPQLRGLYQLNFEVPTGVSAGNQYLEIGGPDTFNSQILLPVAGPRTATSQDSVRTRKGPTSSRASSGSRDR
jgi:uncharacterized protein (TIGR03437 family)